MKFPQLYLSKKITFLLLLGIVTIVISALITIFIFPVSRLSGNSHSETTSDNVSSMIEQAQVKPLELGSIPEDLKNLTILLLGYGGAGHQGGYLTDVLQIVHVDFENKKVSLISIPRDLWIKLPNDKAAKINTAFTLGEDPNEPVKSGGHVAKTMASAVTGLPINYFIAVDFVGFKRIIGEELNGLTVEVPETLEDPWYPISGKELDPCGMSPDEVAEVTQKYSGFELEKQFDCRYEHLLFEKGSVHMEGGDALKYVRSRHGSAGGDFSRSQRQHALLKAIRDKLLSLDAIADAEEYFELMTNHVTTDIDLDVVQYIVPALQNIGSYETQSIVLSTENVFTNSKSASGQFIVIPKGGNNAWDEVHQFLMDKL